MPGRACAECSAPMNRVPYMRDPYAPRVWLDRCPKCRAIWFDAGEVERTTGRDVSPSITETESASACPVCAVPLRAATLAKAPALACGTCRGVHLPFTALDTIAFDHGGDDEPTLKPPALFECAICKRQFSLDQGDGITCRACAPRPAEGTPEEAAMDLRRNRYGLGTLLDFLFF